MTPTTRSVLRGRSAPLFLLVVTAGSVAAIAQVTALGLQVFDLTGRELDLGLLGLAEFLPAVALVVVSGALADRFDRRLVMAVGLVGEAAASLLLAWRTADGTVTLGQVLALVVLFGTFRAVGAPAFRALPASIVAPESLPRYVPLFAASWQAGAIIGPVVGGWTYAVGPAVPYLVSAGLLVASALAVPLVRLHDARADADRVRAASHHRPTWREAVAGLRVIRRSPVLLGAISLDLFAVLFGGAVALLPAIARTRLGVGPAGVGWLRAAGGIGAAVTTVTLATAPVTRRVGRVLLWSVAVFGVATIFLGATTTYWVALASMFVLSGADAVSVFIRATLVPLVTPDRYRGRVLAVENVFIGASNELGAFQSGLFGQVLGAPAAIVVGGVATLGVVTGWWVGFPALREVDRFADLRPDEHAAGPGDDPG